MNTEELVAVYTALLEIADEQEEWDSSEISQRAGLELQETEILLDELEHMGFVEIRNGHWNPRIQPGSEEDE
jgi:DNA-binding IscR family transcriptional regulator